MSDVSNLLTHSKSSLRPGFLIEWLKANSGCVFILNTPNCRYQSFLLWLFWDILCLEPVFAYAI